MILTLISQSIGAHLFLVIVHNVMQQYKQEAQADKRQAIQMLPLGKIDPQEDRRLEPMQLKINISDLVKRAMDAQRQGRYGTCHQLYTKGLIPLEAHLQRHSQMELQSIEDKETDELDVLFQPKKKW